MALKHGRDCLNEGELRALVESSDAASAHPHLASCAGCRERYHQLRADAGAATALLGRLMPVEIDTDRAYRHWRVRRNRSRSDTSFISAKGDLMSRFSRARRGALAGGIIVALMALVVGFAPVSTLADNIVNQFRQVQVQQFQAITIPANLADLQSSAQSVDPSMVAALTGQLQGLGTPSTTLSQNNLTKATSIADAKSKFSGDLLVPSNLGSFSGEPANIGLSNQSGNVSYALDVAKATQLFQQVGLGTDWLTTTQPTVTFTLELQPGAAMEWEQNGKHLVVGQMINPTLDIPDGVNMDQLRTDILQNQLVGAALGPDIKAQLQNVTDWQHTLIIPVPQDATSKSVTVNSTVANNGMLVTSSQGSGVIWLQNGVLHVVASDDAGVDVLAIAKSES